MNKFIPLLMGLMLPLASAMADDFVDQAVEFCKSKGGAYTMGTMVEEGDNYCRQVLCKKTTSDKYVLNEGDKGPEANVEATKRVCVSKSIVDGNFNTNGAGNSSGSASGATAGATSGSGVGAAGATSGATAGAAAGSAGGAESYVCEELEGEGRIEKGGLCYSECKPRRSFLGILGPKKEGFERKSCVDCLLKYPGVYHVKKEYLPRDKDGKIIGDSSVSLGRGVTVKTGTIVCKDSKGNIVSVTGSACPTGSVLHTTSGSGSGSVVVVGGGAAGIAAGSGSGSIIIAGGAGGTGGIQRPAFCDSSKKKDLEACAEWMRVNARFLCSSSGNASMCMGGADADISARYSVTDCVNCGVGARKQSTLSGIAEIVGALAPPLAQFGSAYVGARAYQKGQEAWAGAAATGFEQCQISQNNYLQYLSANELPALTPAQQQAMTCNGYSLGGYAGLGSSGLGSWYGAGYTPGFIGGMMGPYGGYNPYGVGGYVGGAVGGIGITGGMGLAGGYVSGIAGGYVAGGYVSGISGGYVSGIAGGYVNGISIAGGINAGMTGGYVAGGYVGGYPGLATGYVAGGMTGYPGYVSGGYVSGYTGGIAGGLVNGISIAGGINGGYVSGVAGGYMAGGYLAGGYAGGYVAAGQVGGYYPGGVGVAGGYYTAGVAGGYYAAGVAGGYAAGYNPQATMNDRMLQQAGTQYQMGQLMGTGYGYGSSAMYSPMNAGYSLTGSIGFTM